MSSTYTCYESCSRLMPPSLRFSCSLFPQFSYDPPHRLLIVHVAVGSSCLAVPLPGRFAGCVPVMVSRDDDCDPGGSSAPLPGASTGAALLLVVSRWRSCWGEWSGLRGVSL